MPSEEGVDTAFEQNGRLVWRRVVKFGHNIKGFGLGDSAAVSEQRGQGGEISVILRTVLRCGF